MDQDFAAKSPLPFQGSASTELASGLFSAPKLIRTVVVLIKSEMHNHSAIDAFV